MLVTCTNVTTRTINKLETLTGGTGTSALLATGGNRTDPLPYPFGHIGELLAAGTKQLPMHDRDWRYRSVPGLTQEPSIEWQQLVQAGVVTLTLAAETGNRSQEDLFVAFL
jgi:hypothetical protein